MRPHGKTKLGFFPYPSRRLPACGIVCLANLISRHSIRVQEMEWRLFNSFKGCRRVGTELR